MWQLTNTNYLPKAVEIKIIMDDNYDVITINMKDVEAHDVTWKDVLRVDRKTTNEEQTTQLWQHIGSSNPNPNPDPSLSGDLD